jgi:hypothetical protein
MMIITMSSCQYFNGGDQKKQEPATSTVTAKDPIDLLIEKKGKLEKLAIEASINEKNASLVKEQVTKELEQLMAKEEILKVLKTSNSISDCSKEARLADSLKRINKAKEATIESLRKKSEYWKNKTKELLDKESTSVQKSVVSEEVVNTTSTTDVSGSSVGGPKILAEFSIHVGNNRFWPHVAMEELHKSYAEAELNGPGNGYNIKLRTANSDLFGNYGVTTDGTIYVAATELDGILQIKTPEITSSQTGWMLKQMEKVGGFYVFHQ